MIKQVARKWNQLSHPQSGTIHLFDFCMREMCQLDDKDAIKSLREEALNQIAQKQKQRNEASATLLNENKREAVREQMKVAY